METKIEEQIVDRPSSVNPQELFIAFMKENNLTLLAHVISPRTQTSIPVIEYTPDGWNTISFTAIKRDD